MLYVVLYNTISRVGVLGLQMFEALHCLQAVENVGEILEQVLKVQAKLEVLIGKLQKKHDEESKTIFVCYTGCANATGLEL